MSELYRDFIDRKADQIVNSLGGAITPPPANAELYRDFLDRKFDDVINAIGNVKIKSFTYTGNDALSHDIVFDELPKLVLIEGILSTGTTAVSSLIMYGITMAYSFSGLSYTMGTGVNSTTGRISYNGKVMTLESNQANRAFNQNGVTYYVYYI